MKHDTFGNERTGIMDTLHSLITDAPLGMSTIIVSGMLFLQTLFSGVRFSSLERQRDFLMEQKLALETQLEEMRVEMRSLRLWAQH